MDSGSCARIRNLLTLEMDHRSCSIAANRNLISACSAFNSCAVTPTKISAITKDATYTTMTLLSPASFWRNIFKYRCRILTDKGLWHRFRKLHRRATSIWLHNNKRCWDRIGILRDREIISLLSQRRLLSLIRQQCRGFSLIQTSQCSRACSSILTTFKSHHSLKSQNISPR